MEVEQSSNNVIAKKLWKIVKIVIYMLKKSISKSKLVVDLHMMIKKGKLAGSKAISNLMLYHHYTAFTCRSTTTDLSFISPQEYEFSCSNTPFYASYFTKRRSHHQQNSIDDINIARKVFEMLNNHEKPEASPFVALPGFGPSPMVRQLRISDSPFPLKEEDEHPQVDKAAEEFIKKFYKELKQQKRMTPSPYNFWAR